jgi:hypothetical protein
MTRLSRNFALWIALSGLISYGVLQSLIGRDTMGVAAAGLALGSGVMIALTWGFSAWRAVRTGAREGEGLLTLAIFILAVSIAYRGIYAAMFQWFEEPEWMLASPFNAFGHWWTFCGFATMLLAPGTVRGHVPNRNFVYIVVSVGIGCLVAGITIGLFMARRAWS